MYILAFDTSNQALSAALFEDDILMGEITLAIKKNHSISLMPTIDYLIRSCDLTPQDLDRIVVAKGPGSYTGLRVAVATAKTLAYSLGIDLVGLSSLQALTDIEADGVLIPLIDARRNTAYAGFYDQSKEVRPDCHATFESILSMAKAYDKVTFVGEVRGFAEQIKEYLPQANILETKPSAVLLARLGKDMPTSSIQAFVPEYLKKVEAEEKWLETHQTDEEKDYIKRV